jgi:two-component system, cell cycle response regulator
MQNKSVMVVDDSSTIRKIIQRELSSADYEVILAKNGMEALAILEWADPLPDLISLDIDMPHMNGLELCAKIRKWAESDDDKKKRIAALPIIFVSANDNVENREKGYQLEVIDFIGKPFLPGKMLSTVNNILKSAEQFDGMSALIVEDSPFVSRIVKNILSRHGLKNIFEASSGSQALELIKNEKFRIDIIITDYIMPGVSGEELCRTLRGIEALEQIPIFFISSITDKKEILNIFKSGASDYLPKPFIEEEFRARIVTHLRNRKYTKELERLNAKFQYFAERDSLTGVYNRGYFQSELASRFSHCQYSHDDLGCILIDLDYFKKINDNYGHAYGDLVLKEFSKILTIQDRASDVVARYGGEEFVILLQGSDFKECLFIAEQIRSSAESVIYNNGTIELQVTVSIGVASLKENKPDNPERLVSMADDALYQAKENGRNRVVAFNSN